MYKIIEDNEDILGYVENIQDAEIICNEANKYNSLASESASVYEFKKIFMADREDYIPKIYLQIQIRMSPRKRFVINIGVYKSRDIIDVVNHVRNKDVYTFNELAMFYLIPKQNETVEELKDRCLKTAIDIIDCHKEWKEYKEYEIYLDTTNGQERVQRKDD